MKRVKTMDERSVAIIGGGITVSATAYYLQKEAQEKSLPIRGSY
jgi:glycine/D-amino acid oxidase-like deaminating enzyme